MCASAVPDVNPEDGWEGTPDEELRSFVDSRKSLIKVVGVGGAGSNTVNRLFKEKPDNVDLIACNTDAKHLLNVRANFKILLGENLTRGLGTGSDPRVGEASALESESEIAEYARGTEIAFVTTGLGGGTGTGAAPVMAKIMKEHGALTIGIVTLPFTSEGKERRKNALSGLRKLKEASDTVIVIPNDRLLEISPDLPLEEGFRTADEIMVQAIRAVTEIIKRIGLINLDYNDLKEVTRNSREMMIGIGTGEGSPGQRAVDAVHAAMESPFLKADLTAATGIIINVTGGKDMEIEEPKDAVEEIRRIVTSKTRILMGTRVDPELQGKIQVTLVAAGVSYAIGSDIEDRSEDRDSVDIIK